MGKSQAEKTPIEDVLEGRLSRRSVLKRAAALGLSAPVIAGLLAACGEDEPVDVAPAAAETPDAADDETPGADGTPEDDATEDGDWRAE